MTAICEICRLPVEGGQPVHGATGNHWDCQVSADRAKHERKGAAVTDPAPLHEGIAPAGPRGKGRTYTWPFSWHVMAPSHRSHTHSADAGRTGWRLHYVDANKKALCGARPGKGWAIDLFIDRECRLCVERAEKLGVYRASKTTDDDSIVTFSLVSGRWGHWFDKKA